MNIEKNPERDLDRVLRDHEARLQRLESMAEQIKMRGSKSDQEPPSSLSDHILLLRQNGFFSELRTADEVHKKLQETYRCEAGRVATAVFRLSKRRELRRADKNVNGKLFKAYVW